MKDSCFISKRPPLRFHPVKPFDGPRGIFDKDPPLTKHQFSLLPENMYCGYLLYTGGLLTIEKQDIELLKFDHTRVQLGYC